MSIKADVIAIGIAGAVLLAAGWYAKKKATQVAQDVKNAAVKALPYVDPTDSRNLAYSGVNALGGAISGSSGWTLGGWLYDVAHPNQPGLAVTPMYPDRLPLDFGLSNPTLGWDQ
jgi:hypothetical protein